jgi:surface antigen
VDVSIPRGSISCVPYARMVTGLQVTGNGGTWWNNAAGIYQRGHRPEPGSVLVFRSSGGMRMGHVAVVERQVSAREITVHHANWEGPGIRKGTVTRNISVVDVSDANDWTAVRVQVGHDADTYGRTYPTYGFIFNRPDGFPAQRGPIMVRHGGTMQEVAEAPEQGGQAQSPHQRFINTSIGGLGIEGGR